MIDKPKENCPGIKDAPVPRIKRCRTQRRACCPNPEIAKLAKSKYAYKASSHRITDRYRGRIQVK